MPPHANPVIECLQGEVQVLLSLDLNHHQPAIPPDGEQVENGPVGSRKSRDLRVHRIGFDHGVDRIRRAPNHRFKPALRLLSIECIPLVASGAPAQNQLLDHCPQLGRGLFR